MCQGAPLTKEHLEFTHAPHRKSGRICKNITKDGQPVSLDWLLRFSDGAASFPVLIVARVRAFIYKNGVAAHTR